MTTPRLRFAPSPTGPLHIGGARTAIYNWAAARAMGGRFLLRIEDTDQARSTDESLHNILEAFRWLGIDWDEGPEVGGDCGPYHQSQRLDLYQEYAENLLASGHAYKCYCTPEEVQAGREALVAAGKSPMYDRRCRDLDESQQQAYEAEGRSSSLRFRMPLDEELTLADLGKGEVVVNLREVDDWVMVRAGGMPLYNFACVVDDLLMGITHVVRGEEHFVNGVKQQVMFRALDKPPPQYAHIPLILGKNGKKLSKRDASTALLDYRDQGFSPESIFNYIALLGWSYSGEQDLFTRDEMVAKFVIEEIGKSGAKFDEEKLHWMAGEYLRQVDIDTLLAQVRPFVVAAGAVPEAAFASHPDFVKALLRCNQERIRLYTELAEKLGYFFSEGVELDAAAEKNMRKNADAPQWLAAYADLLEASNLPPSYPADRGEADLVATLPSQKDAEVPDRDSAAYLLPAHLEADARGLAERLDVKFGHRVHPVRAALTGTNKGPGLFDIVYLLGKEKCLQRLRASH
ncbi:MAG: glutamate--tRNA ligase [Planctomycetota bacterium]|nr:glutamate--tRNA ligase [Planctomycetota bacterium]